MKLILRLSLINFFQFAALTLAAPTADVERRDQIKQTFLENYRQYEKYAYGSDMIKPIAKSGGNSSEGAGLGATIVDSLSTFLIMGLSESDEYKRALAFVKAHEFTTTPGAPPPGEVSMYELTIRYIGGLLSAYQLAGEKSEQKFLVDKAKNLADALAKPAWSLKGQSIPFNDLNLTSGKPIPGRDVNLAEAGSLILEWSLLSKYTGDKKYLDLTRRSMDAIIAQKVEWPGIFPSRYHPENATANSQYFTIGGGSDSFYEYLFKFPVLLGQADHPFLKTYIDFTRSVRQHLASKTGVGNLTFTTDYHLDNKTAINVFSELACFSGGLYAYSGRLLRDENLIQFGLEIAESCGETYTQSALGLCPYAFGWFDASGEAKGWDNVSPARRNYYKEHGYFVNVAFWLQQSEVITSLMYAHRITGQDYWRDVAWRAFGNMRTYAKTDTAWACVDNVNDESAGLYDQTGPYLWVSMEVEGGI